MTQAFDTRQLRNALGRFTTGVTIITCVDDAGAFVGLTANSFNSLSLDPPLVLWSLREPSPSLEAFLTAPRFAVNVLAEAQVDLSRRFASAAENRFAEGAWALGEHGAPVLAGCAAVFECEHGVAADRRRPPALHRPCAGLQRIGAAAAGLPGRALPPAGRDPVSAGADSHEAEAKWIDMFAEVFGLCGVAPGDACAVLSETQSRPVLPQLAELALLRRRCAASSTWCCPRRAAGGTGAGAHRPARRTPSPAWRPWCRRWRAASSSPTAPSKACCMPPSCRRSWPAARAGWYISQRAPRDPGALPAARRGRSAGARRDAAAEGGARAMQVTSRRGHRPAHLAGRRARRRRLGLHHAARAR